MSNIDVAVVLREELENIAPEIDLVETIDADADLREALDIDSMDFLNFVTAIHHRLGAPSWSRWTVQFTIPERNDRAVLIRKNP